MRRILFALFLLAFLASCEKRTIEPKGEPVQKAGASTTPSGCLSGMANALTMTVRRLHFRKSCSRHPETGDFEWSYIFRDETYSGSAGSIDRCMDQLATSLNDTIPYMDIGLTERCSKLVKTYNGEKWIWAFEYAGTL